MEKHPSLIFFFLLLLSLSVTSISTGKLHTHHNHRRGGSVRLFVFGDSYVDTGNFKKNLGSWTEPYGITFPGRPSGRFSDGRVLTDYIASFLGIKTPIPYKWRKFASQTQLQRGMNFAYGGTGVLDTWVDGPNMTTQINHLKQLVDEEKLYSKPNLSSSVALVSVAGNDYGFYFRRNGTFKDMPSFTRKLVKQLAWNLKSLQDLGVGKIAVSAMGPMGCLPDSTAAFSYLNCDPTLNSATNFHNKLLGLAVRKFNKMGKKSVLLFLDVNKAFFSAMNGLRHANAGYPEYKNPLMPCSKVVEERGAKKIRVCKKPELSFFWDNVHPSQNGWHRIYLALRPSLLHQLY